MNLIQEGGRSFGKSFHLETKIYEDLEKYMVENFKEHYNSEIPVYKIMEDYLNEKYGEFITKETKKKVMNDIMRNMISGMFN